MNNKPMVWLWGVVGLFSFVIAACQGKYERLPAATEKEQQALSERYRALIAEAKGLAESDAYNLLHHFSSAALTLMQPADFDERAKAFIKRAKEGSLDKIKIEGARAPGKVRLLLLNDGKSDLAIPFVLEAEGWKIDDVPIGLGDATQEVNLKGNTPASPPSSLAAIAVLQDKHASEPDLVRTALQLAQTKEGQLAKSSLANVGQPWAKTALLYAVWQSGGECESFAEAFPIATDLQKKLYESDTESFRVLLGGLCRCAAQSKNTKVALKVYRGCHQAEAQPRSEYVVPIQELANANPAAILQAALAAAIPYDEDPAANILVGAFHGEKQTAFFKHLNEAAAKGGKTGKLAKDWLERMAKRDEEEPPEAVKEQEGAQ